MNELLDRRKALQIQAATIQAELADPRRKHDFTWRVEAIDALNLILSELRRLRHTLGLDPLPPR